MAQTFSEWGLAGMTMLRGHVSVLIVVDILSFSTAVDIATSRGAMVLPFPAGDREAAHSAATAAGALLGARRQAGGSEASLSPRTLQDLSAGTRLMLPSPNGSRISTAGGVTPVIAGSLRNAAAVADHARRLAGDGPIGVIPAGERWPDGSLRPAIEDLIGAGAIIDAIGLPPSAEARIARDAFRSAEADLADIIRDSVSGRELINEGFAEDVSLALAFNTSSTVPILYDGEYRAATH